MPKAVKLAPDMIETQPLPAAATVPRTPRN